MSKFFQTAKRGMFREFKFGRLYIDYYYAFKIIGTKTHIVVCWTDKDEQKVLRTWCINK